MPTYEYACRSCGEHLEVVQGFKDAALTECGRCGGELRKVFSAAGIIFKGSGYYVTDSRKSSAGSKSSGDAGDAGGGSDGGTDTATKKDTAPAKDTSTASPSTSSDSSANSA